MPDPSSSWAIDVLQGVGYHEFGSSLHIPGDVASTKSHKRDSSTAKMNDVKDECSNNIHKQTVKTT